MLDSVFRCAQCGTKVSRPLKYLHDISLLNSWSGEGYSPPNLMPSGFYTTAASVEDAGHDLTGFYSSNVARPTDLCRRDEIIFNRRDLITHPTLLNEHDVGCCGDIGGAGYNVFCVNGHGIATEFADCWDVHYTHAPRELLHQEAA